MIKEFPTRIVIELTPLCDLSCTMCPRHIIDKNNGFLSFKLWKKLIDEIYQKSPNSIVLPFWRGESLLHKEFIKFSNYALERNIKLHLSTNGHFVKNKNAEILSKFEFITFSLHTNKGYENALKFVRQYKSEKNTIQASFVDCEVNMVPLLEQIIDSEDLFGFDSIRLYEEHSKDEKFGYTGKDIFQPRTFCPKLTGTLVIGFDGTISRCNHIWNTEKCSIEDNTLEEIWQGSVINSIRMNYPDNLCLPCDQWTGNTNGKNWTMENNKVVETLKGNS